MPGERIKYSYIVCDQQQWNRMKTQTNYLWSKAVGHS